MKFVGTTSDDDKKKKRNNTVLNGTTYGQDFIKTNSTEDELIVVLKGYFFEYNNNANTYHRKGEKENQRTLSLNRRDDAGERERERE